MKKIQLSGLLLISLLAGCPVVFCQQKIIVRPQESSEVLINPGIGFTTFQMFNGDNLPYLDVIDKTDIQLYGNSRSSQNRNYPLSSLAYFRFQWRFIEPEQGKYRWNFLDSLLDIAKAKNQKITLRISPYKGKPEGDVPDWYRALVGPQRNFAHAKWVVDPEDPKYAKHFGNMIRELGKRYDGHPWIEHVDLSIVGFAGEGGGTELLTELTMKALVDAYLESFTKTQLIALLHGKKQIEYIKATARQPIGWRQDCLGDLGFWAKEQNGWTHMYDYYPQTILEYEMQDAWKTGHVSFEMCGLFRNWDIMEKYSDEQIQYIIDQSLKWHMSSFNGKSSEVPPRWKSMMDDWQKKMGYRFVLRRFAYPPVAGINSKLDIETWWENKGVAPCYGNYQWAIRLKNQGNEQIFPINSNLKNWLPGDIVENVSIYPQDFRPGTYEIEIAIIDPLTGKPAIQLANKGDLNNGWYSLGSIQLIR
jgi:hypothetical protein